MSPCHAYPVRAGQSHLRRPKIRELLKPRTPQAGMPVFYDMQKKEHPDVSKSYTLKRWFSEFREELNRRKNPKVNYLRLHIYSGLLFLGLMLIIPFATIEILESYRAQRLIQGFCLLLFLLLALGLRTMAEKGKIRHFLKKTKET